MGESASPANLYLAAQSLVRSGQRDEGRDMFRRLDTGDEQRAWTFISRSAIAILESNREAALDAATRAVTLEADNFFAHYQLGLVKSLLEDFAGAAAAFERATELDASDAYAHYFAGVTFSKVRRTDKLARHFRSFLTLAPQAPERPQVEAILRTLQ
jgi:tetratricopeptide (TPR) repeat protein